MNPEWPLILFTFFLCLSGGILGAQGLLTVLGKGKKMQNVALIAALATLVIGGICVFMHLQHWERIFNALRVHAPAALGAHLQRVRCAARR